MKDWAKEMKRVEQAGLRYFLAREDDTAAVLDADGARAVVRDVGALPDYGLAEVRQMKDWAQGLLLGLVNGRIVQPHHVHTANFTWLYCFQKIGQAYRERGQARAAGEDVHGLALFDWAGGGK